MYRLSNSIMAVRKLYKIEERTDLHLLIISPVTVRGIHWQQYHLIRKNVRKSCSLLQKLF